MISWTFRQKETPLVSSLFWTIRHSRYRIDLETIGSTRLRIYSFIQRPFFPIPGNGDTLRVSGKGKIVRDAALQNRFAINGKDPDLVLVVTVEEAFLHCPKSVVRAKLWKPEDWPDRANVPTLAEAMVAHGALSESVLEVQAVVDHDGANRMY
jgi:hypothetical protein